MKHPLDVVTTRQRGLEQYERMSAELRAFAVSRMGECGPLAMRVVSFLGVSPSEVQDDAWAVGIALVECCAETANDPVALVRLVEAVRWAVRDGRVRPIRGSAALN